jgi:hypothetical protein
MNAVPFNKQTLLVAGLSLVGIALLALIYFTPVWWVSLTAPNYPEESFPDGVRIHFHMNGVFNGCKKVDKAEIKEDEALDCVHEMDTINHYVGMYPIAAGGPVERGFSQFLMTLLGVMLLGFACTMPKVRLAILGVAFAGLIGWMYLTVYGKEGFRLQNAGYVEALVTSLDQEATGEAVLGAVNPIVAALRKSLESSGVKVELPAAEGGNKPSKQARLIDQLKATYERDLNKGIVSEPWNGSALQVMSWHYRKSLGRYFNNPVEIEPMARMLELAIHVVFVGLVAAMGLLLFGARKNGGLFYWLLVLVPMALPLFFIIDYSAWLWWYGHTLNDMGAFTVKPFMPTVFGDGKVAQFTTHSYPYQGFFLMLGLAVTLGLAALIRNQQFKDSRANL